MTAQRLPEPVVDYGRCISNGHRWPLDPSPTPPYERPAPRGWAQLFWVCETCGAEKRQRVHRSTGETRNRYRLPKSYGLDGWSRRDWKASWSAGWDNEFKGKTTRRKR